MVIMLPETEKALRAWIKENSTGPQRCIWNCDDEDPLTGVTIDGDIDLVDLADRIERATFKAEIRRKVVTQIS